MEDTPGNEFKNGDNGPQEHRSEQGYKHAHVDAEDVAYVALFH